MEEDGEPQPLDNFFSSEWSLEIVPGEGKRTEVGVGGEGGGVDDEKSEEEVENARVVVRKLQ